MVLTAELVLNDFVPKKKKFLAFDFWREKKESYANMGRISHQHTKRE